MKGGKTRIQRALVLASGKLRFVKNKRAAHVTSHKTTTKHRSVRTYMTRSKKHGGGGGKSLIRTAEKIGQVVALAAPHVDAFILKKDTNLGVYRLSGYHMATGTWHWQGLAEGWGPVVGFTVGAKAFHFINRLLRRI